MAGVLSAAVSILLHGTAHAMILSIGSPWTRERVYELFPRLAERRRGMGNQLSGGAQQMLNPTLLRLAALVRLRDHGGLTIVPIEQHARLALEFAVRAVILDHGRIVYEGGSLPLRQDTHRLAELIGVGG